MFEEYVKTDVKSATPVEIRNLGNGNFFRNKYAKTDAGSRGHPVATATTHSSLELMFHSLLGIGRGGWHEAGSQTLDHETLNENSNTTSGHTRPAQKKRT